LETAPQIGGKLRVAELAGVAVDVGAEAMLTTRPEGVELVAAAGLAGERISPSTTAAQVHAGGRNRPLPERTMLGIPASVDAVRQSGVLTDAGLARLSAEASMPPLPPVTDDVAVGQLVRERMGPEVVERLVDPLLGGVYAGRADVLSLRSTMAALAGRLAAGGTLSEAAAAVTDTGTRHPSAGPIFTTLRGGLGRLPAELAAAGKFSVRTGVTVREITKTPAGFELQCGAAATSELIRAGEVVVAAPAAKAARLLRRVAAPAAHELAAIESASMAIISFAFQVDVDLAGSGLLVGAAERLATKAITVTSHKWPLEADGLTLLRASVGRVGETLALQLEDADLIALVRRELRPLLGLDTDPVDALVTRWGGGLPQYAVGHADRVRRIRAAVADIPGLGVCGAAFDGVGIPACIASARAAVDQVTLAGRQQEQ
jgi:oxygen-dependent protoporphyrinogen oxidase